MNLDAHHVHRWLSGVHWPADMPDLLSAADANEAPEPFVRRIQDLPPRQEFAGPDEVLEALGGTGAASGQG